MSKAKNQLQPDQSQFDMIDYLLENPIKVDNLEFIKLIIRVIKNQKKYLVVQKLAIVSLCRISN